MHPSATEAGHPAPHRRSPAPLETDALVIGAGPVGLFLVFELGLLGLHAHVVDALPHVGGQPVELYRDKAIYDIPAVPVCTGQELTDRLLQQIAPLGAEFHLGHTVTALQQQPDGRFSVSTQHHTAAAAGENAACHWVAKTVFIAAGVGAFQPKRLKVDGLAAFEEKQLFYRVREAAAFAGQQLVVVGGDDTALEWALRLSAPGGHSAGSVTLVHRRDTFQADDATVELVRARCAQGALRVVVGQVTGCTQDGERLTHVTVTAPDTRSHALPLDALLVFQGLSPQLGPVAQWGLAMERKQLAVDTATFSTSVPGIFAVGDVNTYPGKRKLIVCGFHEATLAAYAAAAMVSNQPVQLQYTSSSSQLHRVLGVHPNQSGANQSGSSASG